jgi:pimeloyl-ACP methyl ester carboxylesterase
MFDERTFLTSVGAANLDQLAVILDQPSANEERALRVYFGDDRYARLHDLALRRNGAQGRRGPRGNVVVLPGSMGSALTATDRSGAAAPVWLDVLALMAGRLDRLRLAEDGRQEHDPADDVRATGILTRYYAELLLSLSAGWTVRAFWFDWRKDLDIAADELSTQLHEWFDDDAPVHLVAHSLGGLVARSFIQRYPQRWAALATADPSLGLGGRLIMLGTPNHGSFSVLRSLVGAEDIVRKLALVDGVHARSELLTTLASFVGFYQMLPSPRLLPAMDKLYQADTYGPLNIPQRHLDRAREHHDLLADVVDVSRMVYVAGYNQPTYDNIADLGRLSDDGAYTATSLGDGRVPHQLGRLEANGVAVPTFYIEESHGNLSTNHTVLGALDELLWHGTTEALPSSIPVAVRGAGVAADGKEPADQLAEACADDVQRLGAVITRLRGRHPEITALARGGETVAPPLVAAATPWASFDRYQATDALVRGILSSNEGTAHAVPVAPAPPVSIEIGLECRSISDLIDTALPTGGDPPVDAIAVGHYRNVLPQNAELALDRAITTRLLAGAPPVGDASAAPIPDAQLVLTQYAERGIIRGDLGQPFLLTVPRARDQAGPPDVVIALAGMGVPGRLGIPELTVLARELCWSLGWIGRRHLATVLIGAGNGNLSVRDALSAWLGGFRQAYGGVAGGAARRLTRLTFVERDPERAHLLRTILLETQQQPADESGLRISYTGIGDAELQAARTSWAQRPARDGAQDDGSGEGDGAAGDERDPVPTRVTLELEEKTYRFGAITDTAAIPEREIVLDPTLVMAANDELAAERDLAMQGERGQFLEQLLVPEDVRADFATSAPLVLTLDATTARIHWEMMAQSDPLRIGADPPEGGTPFDPDRFLGTGRGLTRQLRTVFAPPPEPPPPPRRLLRVLVVADPAADNHLPGAQEEGAEVADLFERYNAIVPGGPNRVAVTRLVGPQAATRTNVLRLLMLHAFDVLHYAGHCIYDQYDPPASGWVFTGGARLGARELSRVDRVPRFVFSNACESGITPDRSELRSAALAPSFAEAFFGRGVANFVCTAWPVDDAAARLFAQTLYEQLLGLQPDQSGQYAATEPVPMHAAMRAARRRVAGSLGGARTWGAYQHYGNPFLRFFAAAKLNAGEPPAAGPAAHGAAATG